MSLPGMHSACLCELPWTPPAETPCWSPHIPQFTFPTTCTLIIFQESGRAVLAPAPAQDQREAVKGC